jgi:ubiquinone/menaquinone biosynthesis C-methylase UbiE
MGADTGGFGDEVSSRYEDWYRTPEGRRADDLEKALLGELLGEFPGARSVLEIGCGTGHLTRWLREQDLAVVGLDGSAQMLAAARSLGDGPYLRGDALALPFADKTCDLAVFITALEFLARPGQTLAEALRVSRQGLVLGVLNRWSLLALRRRLKGLVSPSVYDAAHFYGVRNLVRLVRSVADNDATVVWRTTLYPRGWPWPRPTWPWGAFIGMAVRLPR